MRRRWRGALIVGAGKVGFDWIRLGLARNKLVNRRGGGGRAHGRDTSREVCPTGSSRHLVSLCPRVSSSKKRQKHHPHHAKPSQSGKLGPMQRTHCSPRQPEADAPNHPKSSYQSRLVWPRPKEYRVIKGRRHLFYLHPPTHRPCRLPAEHALPRLPLKTSIHMHATLALQPLEQKKTTPRLCMYGDPKKLAAQE